MTARPVFPHLETAVYCGARLRGGTDRIVLYLHRSLPVFTMRLADWIVLVASLVLIVGYGLYRSRGAMTMRGYMLADRSMPWWAMGLSIMATQASAITFIGTTGQAYVDGMRFLQFYFGLPIAMIVISATVVPFFHRAKVITAYQFLETRFDAKTRLATSIVFLIQRGLGVGLALYAPAVVLSVILGWNERITVLIMAVIVLSYAVPGGIKAVTWTDVQQMVLIFLGLVFAFVTAIVLMPADVSMGDALYLAGVSGKLNAVDLTFDLSNRYNLWSGLIGGTFLALAYFGCDQSQVQRYLTGKTIAHSRISLIFNAIAKLPLQFFILLTGAMVFSFYMFERPPMLFNRSEAARVGTGGRHAAGRAVPGGPTQVRRGSGLPPRSRAKLARRPGCRLSLPRPAPRPPTCSEPIRPSSRPARKASP